MPNLGVLVRLRRGDTLCTIPHLLSQPRLHVVVYEYDMTKASWCQNQTVVGVGESGGQRFQRPSLNQCRCHLPACVCDSSAHNEQHSTVLY